MRKIGEKELEEIESRIPVGFCPKETYLLTLQELRQFHRTKKHLDLTIEEFCLMQGIDYRRRRALAFLRLEEEMDEEDIRGYGK